MKSRALQHYSSLDDISIYLWNKIHDTSDLSYLLLKRKKISKSIFSKLQKVWDQLYNDFIGEFGYSDTFISIKQKEIEIGLMRLDEVIVADNSQLTFIEIAEIELEEMKQAANKVGFMETKIAIEKEMKFQINMANTSVREFYSYLKNLK